MYISHKYKVNRQNVKNATLALKLMTPKPDVLKLAPKEWLPVTQILDMKCIHFPYGATQTRMEASPSIDLSTHSRLAI
jgi:hypothetical protein